MRDRRNTTSGTDNELSRRAFLGYAAAALGALVVSFAGTPVVGSFISPLLKKGSPGNWKNLGSVENYKVGVPTSQRVSIIKQDGWVTDVATSLVWVVRADAQNFLVYNAHCTHLGCMVDYNADQKAFACPCHGGVFAVGDGTVMGGPPPRPLDKLDTKIEKGELWVNYQDFRPGIPQKVAV